MTKSGEHWDTLPAVTLNLSGSHFQCSPSPPPPPQSTLNLTCIFPLLHQHLFVMKISCTMHTPDGYRVANVLLKTHFSWHWKIRGCFFEIPFSPSNHKEPMLFQPLEFCWAASPETPSEENLPLENGCGMGNLFASYCRDFTQSFIRVSLGYGLQSRSGWRALGEAAARLKKRGAGGRAVLEQSWINQQAATTTARYKRSLCKMELWQLSSQLLGF